MKKYAILLTLSCIISPFYIKAAETTVPKPVIQKSTNTLDQIITSITEIKKMVKEKLPELYVKLEQINIGTLKTKIESAKKYISENIIKLAEGLKRFLDEFNLFGQGAINVNNAIAAGNKETIKAEIEKLSNKIPLPMFIVEKNIPTIKENKQKFLDFVHKAIATIRPKIPKFDTKTIALIEKIDKNIDVLVDKLINAMPIIVQHIKDIQKKRFEERMRIIKSKQPIQKKQRQ